MSTGLAVQGSFAIEAGSADCRPCPQGSVARGAGQTSCTLCVPPEYTKGSGERQCSSCNTGYYAVFLNAATRNFSECLLCPAGVSCTAGADPKVATDYYAIKDPTTMALQTFRCEGARCAGRASCGPNRVAAEDNPLCGQCLRGFSEWHGECVKCTGVDGGLVFGLLVLAWACVLVVHVFAQRSSTSSALRITLFFWQVAFLVVDAAAWTRWASFLGLNFLTASGTGSCPFPASPYAMILVLQLGPLLPYALLLATAACHFAAAPARPVPAADVVEPVRPGRCSLPPFDGAAYFRTTIAIYYFTFNSVTRHCLEFFSCAELPTGRYVSSMPAVRCDSRAYHALMPLAASLLACYAVVIPAYIAVKLRAARVAGQLQRPQHLHWWGVVYGPFRERALWWGLSQMLFRLLLVAVAVFLWAEDAARLGSLILLCAGSLVLLLLVRPNREPADNTWELSAHLALVVLATTRSMNAPGVWLAFVTLGMGVAITLRLLLGRVLSQCQPSPQPHREPVSNAALGCKRSPRTGDHDVRTEQTATGSAEQMVAPSASHGAALPTSASAAPSPPAALDRTISWVMNAYRAGSHRDNTSHSSLDAEPAVELPQLTRTPVPASAVMPEGTMSSTEAGEPVEEQAAALPPGWEEHISEGRSRSGRVISAPTSPRRRSALLLQRRHAIESRKRAMAAGADGDAQWDPPARS
jgi:hypothetical protein